MVTLVGYAAWFSVTHGYVCRLRMVTEVSYAARFPATYGPYGMVTLVGYATRFSVTHGYVCRLRSPVTHGYGSQLCNLVSGYVRLRKSVRQPDSRLCMVT